MPTFQANIERIGINPFVSVPERHLNALFRAAGRRTGPIPIELRIAEQVFKQNLVKYQGAWRLYLNAPMRKAANKDVGERLSLSVEFDPAPRVEPMPPALKRELTASPKANTQFKALSPSRRKEILRYLNQAKTEVTLKRNIAKVIAFLRGGEPQLAALRAKKQK